MIAIIDYGMGNLRSVQKGLERVGFDAVVTRDVAQIQPEDLSTSIHRGNESGEDAKERRLSASVGTEERDDL